MGQSSPYSIVLFREKFQSSHCRRKGTNGAPKLCAPHSTTVPKKVQASLPEIFRQLIGRYGKAQNSRHLFAKT